MAIRDIFKPTRKTFFNPSGWIDYPGLKNQLRTLRTILRPLFVPPVPRHEESFAEAMKRQGATEADIQENIKSYRLFALIFFLLGWLVFFYTFYLLFRYASILSWLLGMGVTALFFAQAFKYDFWSYQLKERKLGVTFAEWKAHILGTKKGSHT